MNSQHLNTVADYLEKQKDKVLKSYDFNNKAIKYSDKITKNREINSITGDEEIVRAYLLTKLINELGYKPENIEIEKEYDLGRPKVVKPRIDIIVKNKDDNDIFLFIELKSPQEFDNKKDEIIEKQLFNLAKQEKNVRYLVLYTIDFIDNNIKDKCILIDRYKYKDFDDWKDSRNFSDTIPKDYGQALKKPYIKGGEKDLEKNFNEQILNSLRNNLHNVLWGGGGTDDNDVFSSLVNIILAKIQDESEKISGACYDFQSLSYNNGDNYEDNTILFNRINNLYRRALKQRLNIVDEEKLKRSFVIDQNKFSLSKLKYAVTELEKYSFVDGKNSLNGKDILGEFFENIIREGFKQSKGQFFTHTNIVRFILWGLQLDKLAVKKVNEEKQIPLLIDPSAGSGTFLIEYMKFITDNLKRRFKSKIHDTRDIEDKFDNWFYPDNRENKWAADYIYGIEINFNLGTAAKVNMILHGDGSTNIFVKDGLLPFDKYNKDTGVNLLKGTEYDDVYSRKLVNKNFDCVITNPPFSVDLDNDTKKLVKDIFLFGDKKNSENLYIERWYQLLKENGRLGVVLPESVFDTTDNKYIRLFLYKYFKIKAVISLPQLTFDPFTKTKTSLLFAQKKTREEVNKWNNNWNEYSKLWSQYKIRYEAMYSVYIDNEKVSKYTSIKSLSDIEKLNIIKEMLKDNIEKEDNNLSIKELIIKYEEELNEICKYDNDTKDVFGYVNTWWVFNMVAKKLNYNIFMAEVENIGYKRTKRSEKVTLNELYRENDNKEILVDDNIKTTVLDYLRDLTWD